MCCEIYFCLLSLQFKTLSCFVLVTLLLNEPALSPHLCKRMLTFPKPSKLNIFLYLTLPLPQFLAELNEIDKGWGLVHYTHSGHQTREIHDIPSS